MAAKNYRYKSATWQPAGAGSPIPLSSVASVRIVHGGDVLTFEGDGSPVVQGHALAGIEGDISIASSDAAFFANSDFQPGIAGELVVAFEEVAHGSGVVAGSEQTVTAEEAMIASNDADIGTRAGGGCNIAMKACDSAGVAPFAFS